jgi:hypothetical protein
MHILTSRQVTNRGTKWAFSYYDLDVNQYRQTSDSIKQTVISLKYRFNEHQGDIDVHLFSYSLSL